MLGERFLDKLAIPPHSLLHMHLIYISHANSWTCCRSARPDPLQAAVLGPLAFTSQCARPTLSVFLIASSISDIIRI